MNRRVLIAGLGSAAAWPLAARAQQGDRVRRIGVLMPFGENDPAGRTRFSAFTQAFADLGWTDGRNVRMDVRWASGVDNRMRALAQELVGSQPDIILTNGTPAIVAVQRETRTIPIVFLTIGDPVASGIVARLDRPNGNITGFASMEGSLAGKWLELLSEIAPRLKRAAIMFNPDVTSAASVLVPSFETAARSLKVVPIIAHVHSDAEIETAIIGLGHEPGGGLIVVPDAFTQVHRAPIISAAARHNVPAVYGLSFADLLWRDTNGNMSIWFMSGTQVSSSVGLGNVPTNWSVVGIGDFNDDIKSDIVWRDNVGDTAIWLMNGGLVSSAGSLGNVATNWSILQTGDYDGDGKSDLL
jgi:putative tryptophan/tyrosine transport system substrate-binding protein